MQLKEINGKYGPALKRRLIVVVVVVVVALCIPLGKLPKLSSSICPSSTQALPASQELGVCTRFFAFSDEKALISITYFLKEEKNLCDSCFQAHVYLNVLPAYISYNHHDDFLKIKKKRRGGKNRHSQLCLN